MPKISGEKNINGDELLYRGIMPKQINRAENRPSSGVFNIRPDERGVSVDRAKLTSPQRTLERLQKSITVAQFKAEIPIGEGHPVIEDPEEDNPAHAQVLGKRSQDGKKWKISKRVRKLIAEKCSWAISPYDVEVI